MPARLQLSTGVKLTAFNLPLPWCNGDERVARWTLSCLTSRPGIQTLLHDTTPGRGRCQLLHRGTPIAIGKYFLRSSLPAAMSLNTDTTTSACKRWQQINFFLAPDALSFHWLSPCMLAILLATARSACMHTLTCYINHI